MKYSTWEAEAKALKAERKEILAIVAKQLKAAHTDEAQYYCNKIYDDLNEFFEDK